MKMKSIIAQFLNQQNPINDQSIAIEGLFKWMRESPVIFLWSLWFAYLFVDWMIRLLGNMTIAPFPIIFWNFLGWGIINQFWFLVFLPNACFQRKWKSELLILISLFSFYAFWKFYLITFLTPSKIEVGSFLLNESARSLQFLLNTLALWGFYVLAVSQDKFKAMEITLIRLQIEHKSLQLSPHFTLNMLSQFSASIFNLSRDLYQYMSKFTEVLSYSYKNPTTHNSLAQEITSMKSYLNCQKFRFGEKLHFLVLNRFSQDQLSQLPLPKWTLMTLLENVFKHGDFTNENNPCSMTFQISDSGKGPLFSFSLYNPIDIQVHTQFSEFGIEAVKRILTYYHPDHFNLYTFRNSLEFSLLLYIDYGTNFESRSIG